MQLSVAQFAERKGISARRVQAMIADGRLPAAKVGGRYVIEGAELSHEPRLARSMSAPMAWAFLRLWAGDVDSNLSATERARLIARMQRLRESDVPARLLRSWLGLRAKRELFWVDPRDVGDLRTDPSVQPSGVSDPRSHLSAGAEVEGYVRSIDLAGLRSDYLLVRDPAPNVVLHVVEHEIATVHASIGVLAADLADYLGPREDARVADIVRGL